MKPPIILASLHEWTDIRPESAILMRCVEWRVFFKKKKKNFKRALQFIIIIIIMSFIFSCTSFVLDRC